MVEYLVMVVVSSVTLGFVTYLSYPSGSERALKFAVSVLLIYTALAPAAGLLSELSDGRLGIFDCDLSDKYEESGEYEKVTEKAFKDGICELLFTKYGVKSENAQVFIYGFDFKNMSANKIKIILSGSDALADWRSIESYITESGLGECEVAIQLG